MSKCEKCNGYGFIQKYTGKYGLPEAYPCDCRIDKSVNVQCERAWTGLSKIPPKKKSALNGKLEKDLIVIADKSSLSLHLRSSIWNLRNPMKFVKVVSDATLMSAWLSNLTLANSEIYDPDFQRDLRVGSLEDLAESPHLLVIRLGIKMARNSAMPEVLVETIELRQHLSKPTWVVCEPDRPLEEGHLSWSRAVEDSIDGWDRVIPSPQVRSKSRKESKETKAPKKRFSL